MKFEDSETSIDEIAKRIEKGKFRVKETAEVPAEEGKPLEESDPGARPPASPSE